MSRQVWADDSLLSTFNELRLPHRSHLDAVISASRGGRAIRGFCRFIIHKQVSA